jgi:hypothetical protein
MGMDKVWENVGLLIGGLVMGLTVVWRSVGGSVERKKRDAQNTTCVAHTRRIERIDEKCQGIARSIDELRGRHERLDAELSGKIYEIIRMLGEINGRLANGKRND